MALGDFDNLLRSAIFDVSENGFDEERVKAWMKRLREAANRSFLPLEEMRRKMDRAYRALLDRTLRQAPRVHPGVARFTLERLRPDLHQNLSDRISISADLIKLNREEEVEKTLRRFAGWGSSVPKGGSPSVDKKEKYEEVRKSLSGLSFRERRLMIDQGHKLTASVNAVIALGSGAIAAKWISHWHQTGYNFRKPHKQLMIESAKRPFLIRDSWAIEAGLLSRNDVKYTDEMTQPAEEVYCSCYYEYVYQLSALPRDMLTKKGLEVIEAAKG